VSLALKISLIFKRRIKMENQGSKKNKGHGPGPGTFGVKNVGKVANQVPPGGGKGVIGKKVGKINPGSNKGTA
jgi:hypothetical protein